MSAPEHRAEAQKERQEARREMVAAESATPAADPSNRGLNSGIEPELYLNPDATTYQTIEQRQMFDARRLAAHARAHELAAADLERSEATECRAVPATKRSTCPLLGPVAEIRDVDGGVRVRLADGVRATDVLPPMRCHQAYAQAHGWAGHPDCALYLRGVEFRQTSDPRAIELIGPDPSTIAELRRRVHAGAELTTGQK